MTAALTSMNLTSSFYDAINKLIIGLLIIIPFYSYFPDIPTSIPGLIVLSWLIGIFFWIISESILSHVIQSIPFLRKNNLKWINNEYYSATKDTGLKYSKKHSTVQLDSLELNDYYTIYYEVEKKGLLENVPVLESYSAFFTNLIYVCVFWLILLPILYCNHESPSCLQKLGLAIFLLALIIVLPYFRKCTESKIYNSVLYAYFLGV